MSPTLFTWQPPTCVSIRPGTMPALQPSLQSYPLHSTEHETRIFTHLSTHIRSLKTQRPPKGDTAARGAAAARGSLNGWAGHRSFEKHHGWERALRLFASCWLLGGGRRWSKLVDGKQQEVHRWRRRRRRLLLLLLLSSLRARPSGPLRTDNWDAKARSRMAAPCPQQAGRVSPGEPLDR